MKPKIWYATNEAGENIKVLESKDYNYVFNTGNGFFARWGKTKEEDPTWSPHGPEIADIEITTSCKGPKLSNGKNKLCGFCYKSNTPHGKYMSIDTFKAILDKFPHIEKDGKKIFHLTQVAFGVDAECVTNPDVWKIFNHCRENGIIPNLTVASVDDEVARNIAKYCGACAVSRYSDKDVCYNTIDLLTNKCGMNQVNIHQLVAAETLDDIWETLKDIQTDTRLKKLNAIVFLSLKQKGRGTGYTPISQEDYSKIVQYCFANNIRFGSDSCGAGKLLKSLNDEQYKQVLPVVEPCEASSFSFYCDVDGKYYPCSFMANEDGDWETGIDMLTVKDFLKEVWNDPRTTDFQKKVRACNTCLNGCCHFKI
jgi:hypothetical protein